MISKDIKLIMFDFDWTICHTMNFSTNKLKELYFLYYPNSSIEDFYLFREKFKWVPVSEKLNYISSKDFLKLKENWLLEYKQWFDKCEIYNWWIDLFDWLIKKWIKMVIVSNKYIELLTEMLKYFSLDKYFFDVIWEDSFSYCKPDVRLSWELCKKYDLKSNEILYVWNSEVDRIFYENSWFYWFVSENNDDRIDFMKNVIENL